MCRLILFASVVFATTVVGTVTDRAATMLFKTDVFPPFLYLRSVVTLARAVRS
jgi:hypothetical protein